MNDLSIVIVNYNTGKLLAFCIDSIRKTTKNLKVEIVIIDNASSDRSIIGIKSIKGLRIIQNEENLGFAKAVNQGIKKAGGEYILLLNPDTVVKPNAVESLLKFAKENKDVGVVGARLLNPDGSIQPSVFHFPTILTAMKEFWFGVTNAHSKYAPQGEKSQEVDALVGAAFLITPQALERVGVLDERYFMYFEDLDYCRKVKEQGLKVYYLPTAQVVHYHGISGKTLAPQESQWKRLIPSSKIYHGTVKHHLINTIIRIGQKLR